MLSLPNLHTELPVSQIPLLPEAFFLRHDVVTIAQELVGKPIWTVTEDDDITGGIITETEAYTGRGDRACHAYNGKRTARTEVMYQSGGRLYVYLCYGLHNMLNIVTNEENYADAVLIRAFLPLWGIKTMLKRRNYEALKPALTTGPGAVAQSLAIQKHHNGIMLNKSFVYIGVAPPIVQQNIIVTPRIGVAYAGSDALKPWRFCLANSVYVSKNPTY